jgi:hypothetical protein
MDNYQSFYYDPQRQGYEDTLWKTIAGVPAVVANNIVLNAATILGYDDLYQCRGVFSLTIPAAPTAGDDRAFGFAQLNAGLFVDFKIVGAVFSANCINGTLSSTAVIPWNTDWDATPTKFSIRWHGYDAIFYVNDIEMARLNSGNAGMVTEPMSLYIKNANADDLLMHYVEALDIRQIM